MVFLLTLPGLHVNVTSDEGIVDQEYINSNDCGDAQFKIVRYIETRCGKAFWVRMCYPQHFLWNGQCLREHLHIDGVLVASRIRHSFDRTAGKKVYFKSGNRKGHNGTFVFRSAGRDNEGDELTLEVGTISVFLYRLRGCKHIDAHGEERCEEMPAEEWPLVAISETTQKGRDITDHVCLHSPAVTKTWRCEGTSHKLESKQQPDAEIHIRYRRDRTLQELGLKKRRRTLEEELYRFQSLKRVKTSMAHLKHENEPSSDDDGLTILSHRKISSFSFISGHRTHRDDRGFRVSPSPTISISSSSSSDSSSSATSQRPREVALDHDVDHALQAADFLDDGDTSDDLFVTSAGPTKRLKHEPVNFTGFGSVGITKLGAIDLTDLD